jgi:formate hydrogenlyase subunit 6/NADH:ubiquinone oxidoreductase subunit I
MQSKEKSKKTRRISPLSKKAVSNIFSKPATEGYPFVKPTLRDDFRGQPVFDINLCINCGICSRSCPAKAIEMVDVEGKKYPQFNLAKCIFCDKCVEDCPKKAITNSTAYELASTDKSTLVTKPHFTSPKIVPPKEDNNKLD